MGRLDIDRENKLEPKKLEFTLLALTKFDCVSNIFHNGTTISFTYKGNIIRFHAYTGWASGKSIKDGRGLQNLLNQLK